VVRPVSDHTQLQLDKEGLDVIRAIKVSPGYSTRMPLTSIAVMRGRRRSLPTRLTVNVRFAGTGDARGRHSKSWIRALFCGTHRLCALLFTTKRHN